MLKNTNTPEIHLFIIWENARVIEQKILDDISVRFNILKVYEIHWNKKNFTQNLSRFYGTQLPPNAKKEAHIGTNPFLAVIVEDQNPTYKTHTTSKGDKEVNSNLFLAKTTHREWTGGGHLIHGTNSPTETDHDLTLLFGKNTEDLVKTFGKPSRDIEIYKQDVVGADDWQSLEQVLYVLNNTIDYVVLRNFDAIPDKYYAKDHGDIDMLVADYKDAALTTNAKAVFAQNHRVYNEVIIKNEKVFFDFRNVGDNYYDPLWEIDILKRRVLNKKGFYVAAPEDFFYSLLYHAVIQKPKTGEDYKARLIKLASSVDIDLNEQSFSNGEAVRLLAGFLKKNKYVFTQPDDLSVYFHEDHIKIGVAAGAKFIKKRRTPLRNHLKRYKMLLKHYGAKSKRMVRGYFKKVSPKK